MRKSARHQKSKKSEQDGQPESDLDPDYILWGIIYLCRDQRFQAHTLKAEAGRNDQGLLDLMSSRICSLTKENRSSPMRIQFSPNSSSQRVYLFCTVRSGKNDLRAKLFEKKLLQFNFIP